MGNYPRHARCGGGRARGRDRFVGDCQKTEPGFLTDPYRRSESEIVEIYPDSAARRQWKTFAPRQRAGTVPMDLDEDGTRTKDEPEELALPSTEEIYDDLLDPSVRPPYLPFKTVEFSCRPGGPKLYDLLAAKSLDRFGILAWSIIDREEELFEMDGTRDEDKVMQALWCRWIMLNR